jgi:hypothetical protein
MCNALESFFLFLHVVPFIFWRGWPPALPYPQAK